MSQAGTLALNLKAAFEKFATQASQSTQSNPRSTLKVWRAVLEIPEDESQAAMLAGLGVLEQGLDRLVVQINASRVLDTGAKAEALRVAAGFRTCVSLERLTRPAHEFKGEVTQDRVGYLSVIGSTLRLEFRDAQLSQETLAELERELIDLIKQLDKADLAADLKQILRRHATFMLWALKNFDIVGVAGVYDAIGQAMVAVQRVPDAVQAPDGNGGIKMRLKHFLGSAYRAVETAEKVSDGVQAIEHFKEIGDFLLEQVL
jgi:hypothetical protein